MKIEWNRTGHSSRDDQGNITDMAAAEIWRTLSDAWAKENFDKGSEINDMMEAAKARGHFDMKIVIDGKEFDPNLMQDIINGLDKMLDKRALEIASDKVKDALREVDKLNEIVRDAGADIIDKFNLTTEDYDY